MGNLAEAKSPRERRRLERIPTALRGKVFPGEIDCTIADFNERGAKLKFGEPTILPDDVVLVVWSSGLAFEAVVRWRTSEESGVEFRHKRDFRRPVPADLAVIRALWLKRRPRIRRRKLLAQAAILPSKPKGRSYR